VSPYLSTTALSGPRATWAAIRSVVCAHYGITPATLTGSGRSQTPAMARHVAMFMLRESTTLSLPEIADLLKRYDHTSVMAALRKIERLMAEPSFAATVEQLRMLVVQELRVAA